VSPTRRVIDCRPNLATNDSFLTVDSSRVNATLVHCMLWENGHTRSAPITRGRWIATIVSDLSFWMYVSTYRTSFCFCFNRWFVFFVASRQLSNARKSDRNVDSSFRRFVEGIWRVSLLVRELKPNSGQSCVQLIATCMHVVIFRRSHNAALLPIVKQPFLKPFWRTWSEVCAVRIVGQHEVWRVGHLVGVRGVVTFLGNRFLKPGHRLLSFML
jgi:hypothetical protein